MRRKSKMASVELRPLTVKVKSPDPRDSTNDQKSLPRADLLRQIPRLHPASPPCGLTLIGALIKASRYNSYHTNLKRFIVFFIKLCQGTKRVLPPHFFSDADHKPKRLLLLTFYLVTFISLQFQCQPCSSLLVAPIQPRAIASSHLPHLVSTFTHTLLKVFLHVVFTVPHVQNSGWGRSHA